MTVENRAAQADLRRRTTNYTTLRKDELAKHAIKAIARGMGEIKHHSAGEIIFPHIISPFDEIRIRRLVEKRFGNYAYRIGAFTPIRLEGGMGTAILIKELGKRR